MTGSCKKIILINFGLIKYENFAAILRIFFHIVVLIFHYFIDYTLNKQSFYNENFGNSYFHTQKKMCIKSRHLTLFTFCAYIFSVKRVNFIFFTTGQYCDDSHKFFLMYCAHDCEYDIRVSTFEK